MVVPTVTILAVVFAAIINGIGGGKSLLRSIYFVPTVTPLVILSLIWLWMYDPAGPINQLLALFGVPGPNWLLDARTALPAIVLMTVWHAVGYDMVIFSAALADIPRELYDAAKVDGAGWWQLFRAITVPLLRNAIAFVAIVLSISAFQVFTQVYVMTNGGPANATEVVPALIYKNGFQYFKMGYAAAESWLLFAVIFVFTLAQLRWFRSRQIF
jgi:ABC-type sugar transport system permease subunit